MTQPCFECGIDSNAMREWMSEIMRLLVVINDNSMIQIAPELKPILENLVDVMERILPATKSSNC